MHLDVRILERGERMQFDQLRWFPTSSLACVDEVIT